MNYLNDDPLEDLFGGATTGTPRAPVRPEIVAIVEATFTEPCRKCGGTGYYRNFGSCFACKGKGKFEFKRSAEERAAKRARSAAREVAKIGTNWNEFAAEHVAEAAWILANTSFDFAVKMKEAIEKFGGLTENQLAAIRRCILRQEQRVIERDQRKADAPLVEGVDLLKASFDKAVAYSAAKGLKLSPRITVGGITISPAKATSKNPGALYVKSNGEYLGKIAGNKFFATQTCTNEDQAKVLAFVANPEEAAKVYGQTTGTCCVCNATLISKWKHRGIGPICAEKFGWR